MSTATTTSVPSYNTTAVRFAWGFNDAAFDVVMNHVDRVLIPQGEAFCLKLGTDLENAYAAGYRAGQAWRRQFPKASDAARLTELQAARNAYVSEVVNG
jgi:hypothetical protein